MKSDFLYRFIKHLDEGELRFCNQQLQLDHSAVGIKNQVLFQALASMDTYDKKTLRALTEKSIRNNDLPVVKSRLYQRLLQELKRLSTQRLPSNDPSKRLEEGRILYNMRMLEEAAEVLNKGLGQLRVHENLLLEVALRDQLRIVYKDMAQSTLIDKRTQLEYEQVMATQKLATYARYTQINDRMFDYLRNHRVTGAEDVKRGLEELINAPEMKAVHKADSLSSQLRFFTIWQMYYSQQNDLEKSIEMNKRVIELRRSDKGLIRADTNSYILNVSNLIGKLTMIGRTQEALRYLQELELIPVYDRLAELNRFTSLELHYQLYYLNEGNLGEVLKRETKLMHGLRRFAGMINQSSGLALRYNLAVAHMLSGNHGQAKRHFDNIRQMGELPVRLDLQGISRILRLIMLCEEETRVTFEHFLRNSKRFFGQGTRQYPLETVVYAWVEEHARTVGRTEKKASYLKLEKGLASFVSENMLGAEEIQIWAEAQRRGTTGEAVLKERLASKNKGGQ